MGGDEAAGTGILRGLGFEGFGEADELVLEVDYAAEGS